MHKVAYELHIYTYQKECINWRTGCAQSRDTQVCTRSEQYCASETTDTSYCAETRQRSGMRKPRLLQLVVRLIVLKTIVCGNVLKQYCAQFRTERYCADSTEEEYCAEYETIPGTTAGTTRSVLCTVTVNWSIDFWPNRAKIPKIKLFSYCTSWHNP